MPVILSVDDTLKQSQSVFKQFGKKWKAFAGVNVRRPHRPVEELRNSGIGKFLVMVGMGASLERHIDTLKEFRDRIDIVTCDKGLGVLLDHGITPDFTFICDCNILYSKWMKAHIEKTVGMKLISNPYANPRWIRRWKGDVYFYSNRDAIRSERIFAPMLGPDVRIVPAGSNVSNNMVAFFTGSDEKQNVNWAGYERYILVGYDYSWRIGESYYAFSNPTPKRFYMTHRTMIDAYGQACFTSENLLFSAKWLYSYITANRLNVVNCSEAGILDIERTPLRKALSIINPDPAVRGEVRRLFDEAKEANRAFKTAEGAFHKKREELYHGSRV